MSIFYHETSQEFHLKNESISYIMKVLKNGQIGQLYYGSVIPDKEDFGYYIETMHRPMSSYLFEGNLTYSLEHLKQEYPSYGTTDYREPAFEILQENGSRISDFVYESHKIYDGKPEFQGLPVIYAEEKEEAQTLEIVLRDSLTGAKMTLYYTIMRDFIFVLWKGRTCIGAGIIVNMAGIGYIADFGVFVLTKCLGEPELLSVQIRILLMIFAVTLCSFAAAMYMEADIGIAPYDAFGVIIEKISNRKILFKTARVLTDVICVTIGFSFGSIVGVATIITAFCMGPLIEVFRVQCMEKLVIKYGH